MCVADPADGRLYEEAYNAKGGTGRFYVISLRNDEGSAPVAEVAFEGSGSVAALHGIYDDPVAAFAEGDVLALAHGAAERDARDERRLCGRRHGALCVSARRRGEVLPSRDQAALTLANSSATRHWPLNMI